MKNTHTCLTNSQTRNFYRYIKRGKTGSIESLFRQALRLVKQYNAQDEHKLILMAMDIVWSYFQDKFGITPLCRHDW